MSLYVQTTLQHKRTVQTVWLPDDKRVKPGKTITLKGDSRKWIVIGQYAKLDASLIHQDWKVGGLG